MKRLLTIALFFALMGSIDAVPANADPSGTWKWTVEFGGQSREQTLTLVLDGDHVTGTMSGFGPSAQEIAIAEGGFKDGKISFVVTREFQGRRVTTTYSGTLDGDEIRGEIQSTGRGGQAMTRSWVAHREKPEPGT